MNLCGKPEKNEESQGVEILKMIMENKKPTLILLQRDMKHRELVHMRLVPPLHSTP